MIDSSGLVVLDIGIAVSPSALASLAAIAVREGGVAFLGHIPLGLSLHKLWLIRRSNGGC
jgi:hypothetical protein